MNYHNLGSIFLHILHVYAVPITEESTPFPYRESTDSDSVVKVIFVLIVCRDGRGNVKEENESVTTDIPVPPQKVILNL